MRKSPNPVDVHVGNRVGICRRTLSLSQTELSALGVFVALTRARGAPRLTRSIWLSRLGGAAAISF